MLRIVGIRLPCLEALLADWFVRPYMDMM